MPVIAAYATGDVGALNNRTDKRVIETSLNSPAVAEDCRADQGDRQPDQAVVRGKLPRRRLVPWLDWCADPAPNVSGGASAPVESHLINLQRLPDTV